MSQVDFVNCYYDDQTNKRISVYQLKSTMDLSKFRTFEISSETIQLQGRELLAENERPKSQELYVATGEKWGHQWTYVVDKANQRLWAELNYDQ